MAHNQIKGGILQVDGRSMDYIVFGRGNQTLIMIPGLSDGLKTVRGLALLFAWLYRKLGKHYRIFCFSRTDNMPAGFTTRDMARDVVLAMESLGIERASLLGVSLGGMIAQHLAIDSPQRVDKLILVVTTPRCNDTVEACIRSWDELAQAYDYKGLVIQTSEVAYSEGYLKKFRLTYPFLGMMPKPKNYDRYRIMAQACLTHDAFAGLSGIQSPTLVVGGEQDQIVGAAGSRELAEHIPDSRLVMYPQYGHGVFEEAEDFRQLVISFLSE